jgi:hypothetical protein
MDYTNRASAAGSSNYNPEPFYRPTSGDTGNYNEQLGKDIIQASQYVYMIDSPINYGGDIIEREGWELFGRKKLPNYESYWVKFVVPNTDRPHSINPKPGYNEDVQEISQLSYAVFKCFNYIYKNIGILRDIDDFESCYIQLGKITDLIEQFLLKFLIYKKKVTYEDIQKQIVEKLSVPETINKKISNTKNDIIDNLEKGRNISFWIFSKSEIIKDFYKVDDKLFQQIRNYRNIIIHSCPLFQYAGTKVP